MRRPANEPGLAIALVMCAALACVALGAGLAVKMIWCALERR